MQDVKNKVMKREGVHGFSLYYRISFSVNLILLLKSLFLENENNNIQDKMAYTNFLLFFPTKHNSEL